ncbi:Farnesyl pyrophosphate synthase [Nymphon striatum]|nr:Farnesyl pyrophosphate synthase [Nymphon striatum]
MLDIKSITSKEDMEDVKITKMFDDVFQTIREDLLSESSLKNIPLAKSWFESVLLYNVPHGKKNRGIAVVKSFILLSKPEHLTAENLKLACILGWCIELLQAFFLVADDIMDQSETRRGQACWYKKDNNGLLAFNDSVLLESSIYILLKKYFRNHPQYVDIYEKFNDITFKTSLGQCLDMLSNHNQPNFDHFNKDFYSTIIQFKTAYYSFCLPVQLAMYLSGKCNPVEHEEAQSILIEIGQFFQVQDDYLDCFGDPCVTGKVGKDIEEGKCTWLIVNAFALASPEQKSSIMENYGQDDALKVNKVKETYKELHLPKFYDLYEETCHDKIKSMISAKVKLLPEEMFTWFLKKIYKREK